MVSRVFFRNFPNLSFNSPINDLLPAKRRNEQEESLPSESLLFVREARGYVGGQRDDVILG